MLTIGPTMPTCRGLSAGHRLKDESSTDPILIGRILTSLSNPFPPTFRASCAESIILENAVKAYCASCLLATASTAFSRII